MEHEPDHDPGVDDVAAATHQPTLPTLDLPEYHGRKPVGMKTAINGAGNRIARDHSIGDRIILVIEAKVRKAGHEETDDGLIYTETLKVVDLFEVAGAPGRTLITTMRSAYRTAADAAEGRDPIPDLGDVGYTDASGVVLTPREVAALRGDPVRAMVTEALRPAVIVYDDDRREVWPDDFAPDAPRPPIGGDVIDLLDTATGESLVHTITTSATTVDIGIDDDVILDDDDIPPFDDAPVDDVPDIDADPEPPLSDDAAALEAELPTAPDFAFVDVGIPDLRDALEDITDPTQLRRILNAEKQGRGRGLKYRKGALDAIHARIEKVSSAVRLSVVK